MTEAERREIKLAVMEGIAEYDEKQREYRTQAINQAVELHAAKCPVAQEVSRSKAFLAGMVCLAGMVITGIVEGLRYIFR